MTKKDEKPWAGRFTEPTDRLVEEFTASIDFDRKLGRYDIEGSIAHCRMLARQGILTAAEEKAIVEGLAAVGKEMEEGKLPLTADLEDVHMAVEKALIGRIGEAGGKLHTGRSRNDQVALDVRLYLRDTLKTLLDEIGRLEKTLVELARKELGTLLPGYTHLQQAQPVLLSHYLLAFREMFSRDGERLSECLRRVNVLPLGSGALAGTGLPLDRRYVADLLGFPEISKNSMDAVSDRDFIAEFLFDGALLMMHMSRFCEDLVLWSSEEFGFVSLSDAYTTGSSIMPQKKNPDAAELIRGKTGRVYGNLVALLTVLKGLPMTYNRDLQEDKEPLFDTAETVTKAVRVFTGMLGGIAFRRDRMYERVAGGFSTATDLAEYLVTRGIPFRDAHRIVGRIVRYALDAGKKDLKSLSLDEFRTFYDGFDEGVFTLLTPEYSVNARKLAGGTAHDTVAARIDEIDPSPQSGKTGKR
jgi:argininosuccinate lyase